MDFLTLPRALTLLAFVFALSGQTEPASEHTFFNDIGIGKIFSKDIEPSPEAKPYQLPTFNQLTEHYNDNIPALIPATMPDPDAVFHLVAACHPSKSLFNIDIDLKGQISDRGQTSNISENGDYQSITSNYIAIVARMPMYSSTEMQRARDKETDRRKDTAKAVSDFIGAIAKRNHAIRQLALYGSLEKRSQIRVQKGIARTDEQVGYLVKVASAQEAYILQKQAIMEARLTLSSMCRKSEFARINNHLKSMARL